MNNRLKSNASALSYSCKRCLYTSLHPLGLTLDEDGICSGCRIHEEKDTLDWETRWKKLRDLVSPYRVDSGKTYDCIVPVTGANDSYYIVHLVKERLGLNPLLVTYNKYFNTPLGIRNLANLRIRFNCDILYQNVNPISVKKITRTTLRELGSIYWPCIAGQTVFPVQTAVRYKVPLIIWGAHQGMEQVGMFSHENEVEMTRRYRKDHDLMGFEADDLLSIFNTVTEDDIWQYRYPDDASLNVIGVRGIYLGNYIRWDPKSQHEKMVKMYGYQGSRFSRTFDTYDHVDCHNFMHLHDHLKYIKHGYTRVTDHACREIRHGRLSREEALAMIGLYEKQPAHYLNLFCEWLNIHPRSLTFLIDQHRNKNIWMKQNTYHWKKIKTDDEIKIERLEISKTLDRLGFEAGKLSNSDIGEKYITVGKGWPI
jgi:N-acetyl sugar amidotransferase